jgi:hypothetical protein
MIANFELLKRFETSLVAPASRKPTEMVTSYFWRASDARFGT